ncbi:MAG TPA: hypothetical protein VMM36_03250 [Opitutaceae bacterium]|nr:hypothetical protein [Opitutaceae bacterium]
MNPPEVNRRTTVTPEELLAAFVGAVEPQEHPPRASDGIEGTAECGVMRWRERTFDPGVEGGGVSFGPKCEARVTKTDGVLTIRATVTTSVGYWFPSVFVFVSFAALFAVTMFIDPENWKGPWWLSWLLPIVTALIVVKAFWQVRRTSREAQAFLEGLMQSASSRNPRPIRK